MYSNLYAPRPRYTYIFNKFIKNLKRKCQCRLYYLN